MRKVLFLGSMVVLAVFGSISSARAALDLPKDLLNQRDPFKMPEIQRSVGPMSELELYAVSEFKLIGILSGGVQLRAMISSPNGRTYFVKPGMLLGTRKGVIRKITESGLFVREKVVNVLGDEEALDTELKLPSDTNQDVRTITSEHGW